jgi:hypothetical protein
VGPWSDGFAGGQVASVDVVVPEGCTPPVIGGCTIGFWKNHQSVWPGDYDPSDSFDALVGVADAFPGKTLLQVLNLSGTPLNNLGKQFVAALLNAESGIYPLSVQEVKDLFNDNYNTGDAEALKDLFDQYNNGGCAID